MVAISGINAEIFSNIDTLIKMAGSTSNIDDISTELIVLKNGIKSKKEEIAELESIICDARYFNDSYELVDKNIEISLKNKISRLTKKLKEIKSNTSKILEEEQKLHEEISDLRAKIENNDKYITILTKKVNNTVNKDYYKELLTKEEENNKSLKKILEDKNKEYAQVSKDLELNNQASNEISTKLEKEKVNLNEILDNLKNPNAYINEDLKLEDEEKLNTLKSELSNLEKRELELLTDATVIGNDAKELIAQNKITDALEKLKELVTIVKSRPYMDITDSSVLEEELERCENSRIELSDIIDNKTYKELNSNAIKEQITYIAECLEKNLQSITDIQNKINQIDEDINQKLSTHIENIETEIKNCNGTLNEYKTLLKDNNKTSKMKANIENAIQKKEREYHSLNHILDTYQTRLINKIEETNILNNYIIRLQNENSNYEEELSYLKSEAKIDFSSKDYLEEEKDKEELRKLNEEIKAIKNRQKYDKNPNEIYDQIEMLLASITPEKPAPKLRTEKIKPLDNDITFLETKKSIKEKENITNTTLNESDADTTNDTLESTNTEETQNIDTLDDNSTNRIKVIEMIPASTIKRKMEE